MNITEQDEDEIIAIQIGSDIYFGQAAIDKCIEVQRFNQLHPRSTFKFIAELDLDPKWVEYAEYPTIFKLSEVDKLFRVTENIK
ncbi:MAG TPA: hypothetical protein VGJ00_10485 [Rhabdochlamydiaceae bacterium]|jgi:hypothetical protein